MSEERTGSVSQKKVLDSFALLAYLARENDYVKVRKALADSRSVGRSLLMNEVNVGETYYILARRRGHKEAEEFLDVILAALAITIVPNTFADVIAAARLKAEYPLAYADCFAVATARNENAVIMTGDPEFKAIEHLVQIEWLSK